MGWICACGTSNSDDHIACRSCGYRLNWEPRQVQRDGGTFGKLLTVISVGFIAVVLGFLAAGTGRTHGKPNATAKSSPEPLPTLSINPDPHQRRLAELRQKQENLQWALALERERAKKIARDAMKLSVDPLADPDERRHLMEQMDDEHKRMDQRAEELKTVEAEIERESAAKATSLPTEAPPQSTASSVQPDQLPPPISARIAKLRERRAEITREIKRKSALMDDVVDDQYRCVAGAVGQPATCAGREQIKYRLSGEATTDVWFGLGDEVIALGKEREYIDQAIANLAAGRPEDSPEPKPQAPAPAQGDNKRSADPSTH